jgi:hypothetical protein
MSSRRHGYRPGVSWRLVEAAAALAARQVTCSSTTGWGPTTDELRTSRSATDYRRPSRASDFESGEEIAMVLSLEPDATSAPNPTSGKPATGEGPLS